LEKIHREKGKLNKERRGGVNKGDTEKALAKSGLTHCTTKNVQMASRKKADENIKQPQKTPNEKGGKKVGGEKGGPKEKDIGGGV